MEFIFFSVEQTYIYIILEFNHIILTVPLVFQKHFIREHLLCYDEIQLNKLFCYLLLTRFNLAYCLCSLFKIFDTVYITHSMKCFQLNSIFLSYFKFFITLPNGTNYTPLFMQASLLETCNRKKLFVIISLLATKKLFPFTLV